jgi:hypothetical protein
MQQCAEASSSEGDLEASKAFKLHAYHETLHGRTLSSNATISEGNVCGNTSLCYGPHAGFPSQASLVALKGEGLHTTDTSSGAAQTCQPEGSFEAYDIRSIDELLGRTTSLLRYIRHATTHAIGGTAELALRYSITSACTASLRPSHYQW